MKRALQLEAVIRDVIRRRDSALGEGLALPPARRAILNGLLARRFPVETAIRELAQRRDNVLETNRAKIPARILSDLSRQLAAARPMPRAARAPDWLSPVKSRLAAVLTACALITAALIGLARREAAPIHVSKMAAPALASQVVDSGMEPFAQRAAIGPFNLSTNEPASLQASFLPDRRIRFADGNDSSLALRLELPVRAMLVEDSLWRTP